MSIKPIALQHSSYKYSSDEAVAVGLPFAGLHVTEQDDMICQTDASYIGMNVSALRRLPCVARDWSMKP